MSVATELTRIQTAKADIKASIEAKGVTIPSSALIDQYADYVDEIQTGGGTKDYIVEGAVYDPTAIYSGSFDPKKQIVTANIPSGFTSIGNNAFSNCNRLTSIIIPDSVTKIGSSAFSSCTGFTSIGGVGSGASVEIPSGVTSINDYVFSYCSGLKSITIPSSVTSIGSGAFQVCTGLTSVTIGNGVTSIGNNAFSNCNRLTSIIIPDSVTSIGNGIFQNCSVLRSITVEATTPPTLGGYAFSNTSTNLIIYVPAESLEAYKAATNWSAYASKIQAISE